MILLGKTFRTGEGGGKEDRRSSTSSSWSACSTRGRSDNMDRREHKPIFCRQFNQVYVTVIVSVVLSVFNILTSSGGGDHFVLILKHQSRMLDAASTNSAAGAVHWNTPANNTTKSISPAGEVYEYNISSNREARASQHHSAALERIQFLQKEFPFLNMSDLLLKPSLVKAHELTVATIDNIFEARKYRYYYQAMIVSEGKKLSSARTINSTTTTSSSISLPQTKNISMDLPMLSPLKNSELHFLSHIPKTGLTYGNKLLRNLIFHQSPQYKRHFLGSVMDLRNTEGFAVCDRGTGTDWGTRQGHLTVGSKGVCTMWMSEHPPPSSFANAYTMIRNPREHVVSQYFHCKESKPHQRQAHLMPDSLEEWLEAWVATTSKSKIGIDRKFRCYDPRNMQTKFTNFNYKSIPNWDNIVYHQDLILSTNITKMPNDTSRLMSLPPADYQAAKKDLQSRYKLLGLTDRVPQSICLIAILYTGWIPPPCDCTNVMPVEQQQQQQPQPQPQSIIIKNNNSTTTAVATTTTTSSSSSSNNNNNNNTKKYDHGVLHHGATYRPTPKALALIDRLTFADAILYEIISKEIYAEQLDAVERSYGIRVCNELRTDI